MYATGMLLLEFGTIVGFLTMGVFARKINCDNLYIWLIFKVIALMSMALALSKFILNLGYLPAFILYFIFAMFIDLI